MKNIFTVGYLKEAIKNLPDEMPIGVENSYCNLLPFDLKEVTIKGNCKVLHAQELIYNKDRTFKAIKII